MTGWKVTPVGKGLLVTAEDEAKIALQHANLATGKPGNIEWMKSTQLLAIEPATNAC